jgi:hypothetical protein
LPIWSWVCSEATNRHPGTLAASTGRPCTRPRKEEWDPVWKNGLRITVARASGAAKSA